MLNLRILTCLIALWATTLISQAQVPKDNPMVDAALLLGQVGITKKATPSTSPTKFKPTGSRIFVDQYVKSLFTDADERKTMIEFIEKLISDFEASAKSNGFSNDASASLAFSVSILYSAVNGSEIDEEAFPVLMQRFQAHFEDSLPKSVTDRHKQEVHEWALSSAGIVLAVASAAKDEESTKKLRALASAQLLNLIGAKADQLTLKGKSVALVGTGKPVKTNNPGTAPTVTTGAVASGFTHSTPSDWRASSGWFMKSTLDSGNLTTAAIRFPQAIPASGNMGDALRRLWKQQVPAELSNASGGMVYRRYLGNKLFSQFIFGRGQEKGRRSDSIFTLFLIDCGKVWQPVVLVQKYDSDTNVAVIESQSSQYSYPVSSAYAEEYFKSFRCAGAPNSAIADQVSLAGTYNFGSGSNMNYVNIYTGASAMAYVSYGGSLNLSADGTFTYKYSSASGLAGAANFRGATGSGKWSIQGDLLTCTYSKYDQGDGHFVKEHVYRVGGLAVFEGNVKVAILMSDLNKPVNCTTVGDSSQWYSTKK